ncbi:MAG: hypothetical protein NTY19_17505 [Planctomycetota bacterium]|nr:hypothetical protein [Planctomycetota bacterium]
MSTSEIKSSAEVLPPWSWWPSVIGALFASGAMVGQYFLGQRVTSETWAPMLSLWFAPIHGCLIAGLFSLAGLALAVRERRRQLEAAQHSSPTAATQWVVDTIDSCRLAVATRHILQDIEDKIESQQDDALRQWYSRTVLFYVVAYSLPLLGFCLTVRDTLTERGRFLPPGELVLAVALATAEMALLLLATMLVSRYGCGLLAAWAERGKKHFQEVLRSERAAKEAVGSPRPDPDSSVSERDPAPPKLPDPEELRWASDDFSPRSQQGASRDLKIDEAEDEIDSFTNRGSRRAGGGGELPSDKDYG